MTPFLQLRIWFRRASVAQRGFALSAVALLVALVVWTAVPSPAPHSSSVAVGGTGTSGPNGTGTAAGPTGGSGGTSSTLGTSGSGSGSGGAGGSQSAAATGSTGISGGAIGSGTQGGSSSGAGSGSNSGSGATISGVTSPSTGTAGGRAPSCSKTGTLRIGVVVPTAAGGSLNPVIGNPAASQEEADYAAVMDSVNKAGGIDCNKLVGDYATADLTNPSSANQGCLQFQQDKDFAVLGGFEPLFSDDCLLQAHIPTFDQLAIPLNEAKKYYPYYYSDYSTWELLYNDFVHAVSQMGYFNSTHHFGKLGIFYESCNPEIHNALLADLAAVGISGSKVESYNLGCSSAFTPPNTDEAAVLKFKADGVTTAIFDDDIADAQNITNIANGQSWKPTWIMPDYGEVAVTGSAQEHPNAKNFDGALAITSSQYGGIGSHLPETAGTQACDKIMTSHGLPTVYQSGDQFAGSACSQVWMLTAALQHGSLSPAGIVAGLQAVKSVELSFPMGPNDFSAAGTTWGGEFWRPVTYHASCQCWMVNTANYSPSFK